MRAVVEALTAGCATDTEKALALFGFVRQRIRFGFRVGFWDNRASDVLASGVGFCNTKSTLFIALLRGAGIPARQVFVDIHASVLEGLLDPGTPYVDHSYVEVFLSDRWIATDAYIVDDDLFGPAQRRLRREGGLMGYGVHATGTAQWDGEAPAFAQFNMNDPRPISTRCWGPFEDVADFYRRAESPWNRLNPLLRAGMGFFAVGANRKAQRIRESAGSA
ncbi:MAG: transglutaminase-like domain-containing protein [Pseudomonadota bacterium]